MLLGDHLGEQERECGPQSFRRRSAQYAHPFVLDLDNATVQDKGLKVARNLIFRMG